MVLTYVIYCDDQEEENEHGFRIMMMKLEFGFPFLLLISCCLFLRLFYSFVFASSFLPVCAQSSAQQRQWIPLANC